MDCEGCRRAVGIKVNMCHFCERLLCDRCWGGNNKHVCGACIAALEAEKRVPRVASPGQKEKGRRR